MKEYSKVPNIITPFDLKFLEEIYEKNYIICKFLKNIKHKIKDEEINLFFNEMLEIHKEHLKAIINILN